jgi:integrase
MSLRIHVDAYSGHKANERPAAGKLDMGPKVEDLLFEKAVEKYLEWYKANRGAYTYLKYAIPASKALKASFDGKRLSQISPFLIEAHKLNRKRESDPENPDHKPVTDTTINHDLTFLRHMFNKCVEWHFAKTNPMSKVELFKLDNGRTRYLSAEEADRLLKACGADLRILVLAAMHTGFRKSELRSLKWSAVDLVHGAVTVESCYAKNGDARTVPLSPDLATALQKIKDERKPKADDVVFLYKGGPWTAWRKSFNSALKHAGISNFRWHDLRHCFGSWLAMNGVPDKGRMELMGHKTAEMTARYTHLSPGYMRQAIASLPQFGKETLEAESHQISQQPDTANVVAFAR